MNSNLEHENKLLRERNQLLQLENERLLDELECLKLESLKPGYGSTKHLRTQTSEQLPLSTIRFSQEQKHPSIIELERQQLDLLIQQKIPSITSNIFRIKDSTLKDKLKMMASMNKEKVFTGFFRVMFELVEEFIQLEGRRAEERSKQNSRVMENQRVVETVCFVKDPAFVAEELQWVSKFQDQFQIVKLFYQKLLKTIIEKYQITRTTQIHMLLNKFSELEMTKLELYKLAVRADNQQREYELKSKSGRPIEMLQVEINNTLQKITFKENCMREYKSAITKYLKRI